MPWSPLAPVAWAKDFDKKFVVYMVHWAGKDYIGSSSNLKCRLSWWVKELRLRCIDPFSAKARVLAICPDKEYAESLEAKAVAKYDTYRNGHNKSPTGGKGVPGAKKSDVFKKKLSRASKERMSKPAWREWARERLLGNALMLGKKRSPESVARGIATKRALGRPSPMLGRKLPEDVRVKMSGTAKQMWANGKRRATYEASKVFEHICVWCGSEFKGLETQKFCCKRCCTNLSNVDPHKLERKHRAHRS